MISRAHRRGAFPTARTPWYAPAAAGLLLLAGTCGFAQTRPANPATEPEPAPQTTTAPARPAIEPADPRWLDRMPKDDRAALEEPLGYAPPALGSDLKWIGDPQSWDSLRGRVVVIQSWSVGNPSSRNWPQRLPEILKEHANPNDLAIIALHTPEDVEKAEDFLARRAAPVPVLIDSTGEFCDALGIYKDPVNVIIDRNGVVRYAGLNAGGLKQAVAKLIAEPYDATKKPVARPSETATTGPNATFPSCRPSSQAQNFCGERAPEFYVDDWITGTPNARGRVVVLDFWATWCKPCVATIPHMNELARSFGADAVFVAISSEKQFDFEVGLDKLNLKPESFAYSLALDPHQRMSGSLQVRGIPYCIVVSSDWIVRWQGNPSTLTAQTLKQIIDADRAMQQNAAATGNPRQRGWANTR